MKKNVRYIVLVIVIAMLAIFGCTGCDSNQDANASSTVNEYADWEIISVDASIYGTTGHSRIVITAIDADNNVHMVDVNDHQIIIIESGTPYVNYNESYGVCLYITKADLVTYLN